MIDEAEYMQNVDKSSFADFTLENYKRLLEIAKNKYSFKRFIEANSQDKFILWRHDIDFCVHTALKMAQIDAEFNVHSTFFVLLTSEFYNVFAKDIKAALLKILALGHDVGLHFDASCYDIRNDEDLTLKLQNEKKLIDDLLDYNISVFSFHNPTEATTQFNKLYYANMVNTYAEYFQKEVAYCSDSNGYWRFNRLEDVLNREVDNRLQVLTHPIWWTEEAMSPRNKVTRSIEMNAKRQNELYDTLIEKFQRKNIK